VRAFFERADAAGLPLPEDSQALRRHLFEDDIPVQQWPTDGLLSLMALGQHYGLPTRLLDWSRSALKAAYFAAFKASVWNWDPATRPAGATHLCLWAYSLIARNIDRALSDVFAPDERIIVVSAPSAGNPNLHAQEGVFTLYRPTVVDADAPVDRRSLDAVVAERNSSQLMLRFTVPIEEAPVLLRLLAKEGASGARLFPGFGGVVSSMNEERYWRRPEDT
jgi:hypothetical protein